MLEDLQSLLVREPFVAFRLIMTSGNAYDVRSPYQLVIKNLRIQYFFERNDRMAWLGVIDVAVIETIEESEHP
ncbi:MAG TPA: hypothetical protein VFE47_08585 [Tepidisphaeraceae bacterium]|jgi:hypothetical protein|nr:hypothetical protein [Tepidisphaeraceae bacterium]